MKLIKVHRISKFKQSNWLKEYIEFNTQKRKEPDTDSLVYEINSGDVYEQCFKDGELFGFSGYPVNSNYYDLKNKKVFGKMKDEFNGVRIAKFVGLKSKMHSWISVDDREVKKAKGINKKLRHEEYEDVLFNKKVVRHNMKRMQSKLHEIGTYVFKTSLSCFNDKRYVLYDGINTLAYFHKDICKFYKRLISSIKYL